MASIMDVTLVDLRADLGWRQRRRCARGMSLNSAAPRGREA